MSSSVQPRKPITAELVGILGTVRAMLAQGVSTALGTVDPTEYAGISPPHVPVL